MLDVGGFQVTEDLSLVFRRQRPGCFQLNDELSINQEVGQVFAQQRAVFVRHLDAVLLLHVQAPLPQAMRQGVFIDFFEMTMRMVNMNVVGGLPDLPAQFEDGFHARLGSAAAFSTRKA